MAVVARRGPGSALAAAGARTLLRGTPHRELTLDQLPGARVKTALLLGSGFSRLDHDEMPRALAVAELRCEKVIVLPSSFDTSDETVERALSQTRAIVFAREPDSYRRIAALCDARLAHDCSSSSTSSRMRGLTRTPACLSKATGRRRRARAY